MGRNSGSAACVSSSHYLPPCLKHAEVCLRPVVKLDGSVRYQTRYLMDSLRLTPLDVPLEVLLVTPLDINLEIPLEILLEIPFVIPVEIDAFRDPFRHTKRGTSWTP